MILLMFASVALNLFITYKLLGLEHEINKKSSMNHDATDLVPIRKKKLNESEITTQNIPLLGRRINNG